MIKNHLPKDAWLAAVRATLMELGYGENLTLSEQHWLPLFEDELHPVKAVMEMEGLDNVAVAIAYARLLPVPA